MATLFTDKTVKNWPAPKPRLNQKGETVVNVKEEADSKEKGLYLFASSTGAKSFVHKYRVAGKLKKIALGMYPAVSLSDARDAVIAANKLRKNPDVAARIDPKEHRKEQLRQAAIEANKDKMLFRPLVERYLKEHASKLRSYKTISDALGLKSDGEGGWTVMPGTPVAIWGKLPIDRDPMEWRKDVREHDLEVIAEGHNAKAKNAFAYVRHFFNWLSENDILIHSPLENVKSKAVVKARKRVLLYRRTAKGSSDDELRWLLQAADTLGYPFGDCWKLIVLTASRREEVATMQWEHIDRDKREWFVPAEAMKNGQEHWVPLSDAAMAVLEGLPTSKGYVFTTTGDTPISGFSKVKKRLNAAMQAIANEERGEPVDIVNFWTHDLRRTAATGMQKLGTPSDVTEAILSHKSPEKAGTLKDVYQVDDLADEQEEALQAWGEAVRRLERGGPLKPRHDNVIPIREAQPA
ncbi:tyrosine-type recombinase/integrase [Candidatus Phyllobacterium onerii]|uniref:tyrosine-type recombinase/integrase n=1 Tax=Candidatus Phyllobacterium onerii TaxID=3020828 RepID=UPI0023302635|nr:site-specific integrase [Phyllobacterium sp. IY22]